MKTTKTIAKKQRKHLKRKDRLNRRLDVGTPLVALDRQKCIQRHELLSDWLDAS